MLTSRKSIMYIGTPLIVLILALLPFTGINLSWFQILFTFFIYLSLAQMWNLLAGYGGLISLAQPAFIGIAAYTMAITLWYKLPIPIPIVVLMGGVAAVFMAALISGPVFRFGGGLYFAIGTLMLPVILRYWFNSWTPDPTGKVGGGAGFAIKIPLAIEHFYWIGLTIAFISTAAVFFILRSKYGLGIKAIRDDATAAASSGINVFKVKFFLFVFCAFITGLVGAVYYIFVGYVEPKSAFDITWTINQIVPVVLGGIGIVSGPFVGTAIFIVLYFVLAGDPAVDLFIKGSVVVIVLLIAPEGIAGLFRKVINKRINAGLTRVNKNKIQ